MAVRLRWERDGADWPNREASRFVAAGGLRWHVQIMGEGPAILLAHGTGAATHSWAGLAPILARRFMVVAPDLPGHGFTESSPLERMSLPGMAASLASLLETLDCQPALAVGHSAGAAILARMCLDGQMHPRSLISLNGALLPMQGMAGRFFAPAARLLATTALTPKLFAWRAGQRGVVERLLRGTGSRINAEGIALYRRLTRSPAHVAAALDMMANWQLDPLVRDLPRLRPHLLLITASEDRAIPPDVAFAVRDIVPGAQVELIRGLGHLAHEERPDEVAALILAEADAIGVGAD